MLHIVIVNYNSVRYLAECLDSLQEVPADIHVVDNASTHPEEDVMLEQLAARDTRVQLTRNDRNIGFGPAVNRVVSQLTLASDDVIWILNPDTTASASACEILVEHVRSNPKSIVSPVIVTGEMGQKLWFAGGNFNPRRAEPVHIKEIPFQNVSSYKVSFLAGAALMMTTGTWRYLGGFREDLFMYWEDVDLSRRATELGIDMAIIPAARIWHRVGASSAAEPVKAATWYYYMFRNRLIVCAERRSQVPSILFGRGLPATLKYFYIAFRDPGPVGPRLRAIIEGIRAGTQAIGENGAARQVRSATD